MFGLKLKCVWGKLIYINLNHVWDGPRLAAIKYEKYLKFLDKLYNRSKSWNQMALSFSCKAKLCMNKEIKQILVFFLSVFRKLSAIL